MFKSTAIKKNEEKKREPETEFNIFDRFALFNAKGCVCRWSILVSLSVSPISPILLHIFISWFRSFFAECFVCVCWSTFLTFYHRHHMHTCNSKYSPTTMSSRGQKRIGAVRSYMRHMHACMPPKNYGTLKFRKCLRCEDQILSFAHRSRSENRKTTKIARDSCDNQIEMISHAKSSFPIFVISSSSLLLVGMPERKCTPGSSLSLLPCSACKLLLLLLPLSLLLDYKQLD